MTRTVLITGVSSGIGHAVTAKLIGDEYFVIGIARKIESLEFDAARFCGFEIDLSNLEALPDSFTPILDRFPQLDAAIFCAGRGQFACLEEFSYSQIRNLMDLNFTSQAFMARAIVPMLKQKKRGDIIFIGSEAALKGASKGTIYCASKFALRGFTQALREECARSGVRIALINPGMVRTGFFDDLNFTHGDDESNYILPEDIAEMISSILRL